MSSEIPCEAMTAAQADLAGVRQLLLHPSPKNLAQSLPLLESAVHRLEQLQAAPSAAPSSQLDELSLELTRVTALLHHAGRFHLGWATFLAPVASEYGLTGTIFPTPPSNRMAYDG